MRLRSSSSSSSESSRSRKRARRSNFVATLPGGSVIQSYEEAQADPNISAEDLLEHMVAAEASEVSNSRIATGFSDTKPSTPAAAARQTQRSAPSEPLQPIPAPPGMDPGRWKAVMCVYFQDGTCRKPRAECSFAHGPEDLFGGTRGRPSSPRRTDFSAGLKVNCVSKDFHIPENQVESLLTSSTKQAIIDESGLQEVILDTLKRKISVVGTARQIEKASILLQRVTTHCRWGVNAPKIQAILRPRTTLSVARCTLSPMMTSLKRFSTSLTFARPTMSIGTDKGNSLVIRGPLVSRVHAQLEFVPTKGIVYVVDLSTNGTWLNGHRLPEKGSAKVVLWHGDELLLASPNAAQNDGGEFGYIANIELD